jgi:hypothetical protein
MPQPEKTLMSVGAYSMALAMWYLTMPCGYTARSYSTR